MNAVEPDALTIYTIGETDQTGSLDVADGRITLTGGGHHIGGGRDAFTFAYVKASGDFDLVARLHEARGIGMGGQEGSAAVGGLAIRENLEPGSRGVILLVPPLGRPRLDARYEAGGRTLVVAEPFGDVPFPMWLKLERRGPAFHAWVSHDGLQWSHFASTSIELQRMLYAGLILASSPRAEEGIAVYSDVYVEELPSGNIDLSSREAGS